MKKRMDVYKPNAMIFVNGRLEDLVPGTGIVVRNLEDPLEVIKPEPRIINLKEIKE